MKKSSHRPSANPPFEAYKGIRPYMFSSYAHKDMEIVFKVLKKLNKNRYRIWYDEGIEPGNEWPEVVGNAVINCAQFIAFMSPAAADSRNVRNEVNLAFNDDKEIIVVYLRKTNLSSGMRLQIGTVQFINHYELTERGFYEKLTKVLNSSLRN
ncbi:MAG: toll/interleukin-1 receptor domain-containing protein [Spirochaetes bacterium]|nr:toll/interleukin-1 receptor domain-containing protein [Spirochaetota bacterium]